MATDDHRALWKYAQEAGQPSMLLVCQFFKDVLEL